MKHPGYPLFYLDGQRFKTPNLAGSSFLIDLTMAKHVPFADDMICPLNMFVFNGYVGNVELCLSYLFICIYLSSVPEDSIPGC